MRSPALVALLYASFPAVALTGQTPIPIFDGSFELSAVGGMPSGWTAVAGTMWVTNGMNTAGDPPAAQNGSRFVSATWQAIGLTASPYPAAQAMQIERDLDLSAFAAAIDVGDRQFELTFAVNAADPNDAAVVRMTFLDASGATLATAAQWSSAGNVTPAQVWETHTLTAQVPIAARTCRLVLLGELQGSGGSARNVSFDSLSAQLDLFVQPPPPDTVAGSLLQLNENGSWCWYQDERAVVDHARNELLVGAIGSYGGLGGQTIDGLIRVSHLDLATRRRTLRTLDQIESYGGGDDHNVPALLVKDDGDVLAAYAGHNQVSGTLDDRSFLRTFATASGTWGPISEWHWWPVIPPNAPGSGGTTYANLFQLSAEDPDGDTHGRIYNFARTQQSPHIMYSDDNGAVWHYGGQLTERPAAVPAGSNYVNGYYRYWSNRVDRIDLIATEYHPRDFNTSIYHAYIQGGQMFDSVGNVIDPDIFDAAISFQSANVVSTDEMTPVFVCDGVHWSRAWNTDVHRFADGTVVALFKARPAPFSQNANVAADDHRVFYGRFDPVAGAWSTHEICKAGARLFSSEQDYTGLGAIDPNSPDRLWVSTEVDPTTGDGLAHHEIYEGVTADAGSSWTWTALTANSTVDNRRPIVPTWDERHTALLWWRGTHTSSIVKDAAVVGLLLANDEQVALPQYHDADLGNTARADGLALTTTTGAAAGAADGNWHLRTGFANGGAVFAAGESGSEDAPLLRTTITGVSSGSYDVFACFWTDPGDWCLRAGLSASDLMTYRRQGAQSFGPSSTATLLLQEGNRTLMRAYLGRVEVTTGSVEVFVDDAGAGSTMRTWYDGIALAPVVASTFGAGCGSPALTVSPQDPPLLGQTAAALVDHAPTALTGMMLGLDATASGAIPLPLDLTSLGMPSCFLLQSFEVLDLALQPLSSTQLRFALAVPNAPSLLGVYVYLQSLAYSPGANPFGFVVSNALAWRIASD